jgi:acetyl-CoA synthetase
MRIETVEDVDRQIAAWGAAHTGSAVAVAELLCDRHAAGPDRLALRYQDAAGTTSAYSFAEMRDQSARLASVLRSLGVARGDRVATLLPKSPELMIATRAHGVTNFAAAPTIYRAMRAAGAAGGRDDLGLRVLSSAGEPLNPDVIAWTEQTLGVPVYDHYGQTEHVMMVINHHAPALRQPLRPGSMGIEMRGFHAVIVDDEGHELGPGQEGQVGLDIAQSPLYWFGGYYKAREWSDKRIIGGRYYLTGDAASRDADNFFYFTGRTDDIISSGGYRIGPFEVENALMQHPAVAEVAVVGKPDELRGEVVTAFVVLKAGHTASEELGADLSQFVKANLSAHAYPRAVTFVDQLPKTPSGKVQRFLLRQQT